MVYIPQSIDDISLTIISMNKATLWELNEKYDIFDVIILYDICISEINNKIISIERSK